jgi:hypothetical protein
LLNDSALLKSMGGSVPMWSRLRDRIETRIIHRWADEVGGVVGAADDSRMIVLDGVTYALSADPRSDAG